MPATCAARLLVLSGAPFGEEIATWWSVVGRSHEEIVGFRGQWQSQVRGDHPLPGRSGVPVQDGRPPDPTPEIPQVRLRTRR